MKFGDMMVENRYTITAVQRSLRLLKLFNSSRKSLTLTEITRLSGLGKSTNLRLCATLTDENFLKYDSETKKYSPGIELFRLGTVVSEAMDIRSVSKPYIDRIAEETGLIVHIGILEGKDVVIVEKLLSRRMGDSISMVSRIGGIVPIHCTGVGKTILAFHDEQEVRNLLIDYQFTKYSERTITNIEDFISELKKIHKRGYGINDGEHEPYIKCFTCPIYNHENIVVAAMSLTGLKEDMNARSEESLVRLLKGTTQAISRELGYLDKR